MMVRTEETADDSLAAIRARMKLGIEMAAMTRMIATTSSSSINENPSSLAICCSAIPRCGTAQILREGICIPGAIPRLEWKLFNSNTLGNLARGLANS
jgi:hypothetical protein